jgi:hypothetical protein
LIAIILAFVAFFRILRNAVGDPAIRGLLLVLAVILATGTVSYHFIEDWSLINAFYFCVVSLLTVGYGDLTPTTDFGKLFTVCYLFIGVGFIATSATTIVQRSRVWARIEARMEAPDPHGRDAPGSAG